MAQSPSIAVQRRFIGCTSAAGRFIGYFGTFRVLDLGHLLRLMTLLQDVGWHTFRRSYISLLASSEKNVKLVQELSRHSTIGQTMIVYAQAMEDEKLQANARVVEMIGTQSREMGNMSA